MNYKRIILCVIDLIMLLSGLYFVYLTLLFCWAAGGPPSSWKQVYADRCTVDFALACLFFAAFTILFIVNIRLFLLNARRLKIKELNDEM